MSKVTTEGFSVAQGESSAASNLLSEGKLMDNGFQLDKWVWTDNDFDDMAWHDCSVYSIAFCSDEYSIAFDIDYIFEWIHSEQDEKYFKFWIVPATLVFDNIYNLCFDISSYNGALEIDTITRENPLKPNNASYVHNKDEWTWRIECQQGTISFQSIGYKMYVKMPPILSNQQKIALDKRGGINFSKEKLC
jgi:hypothetical protein